jgi:hypothetical protein
MIALALALAASQPGALKTFGDWTVGCDNGRACQAVALLPEEGDGEGATLTLTRGPEANAEPVVWVTAQVEGAQSPQQLVIDAKSLPLALDGNSERLLVRDGLGAARMLGQATSIVAVGPGGGPRIPVSARGSAAALLYMDEQQGRLNSTSALVRRGAGQRVPPPPPLPIIKAPPSSAKAPRRLSEARVRQLLGREITQCEYAQELWIQNARLDARHSLVLASHPCGNGAYNSVNSAYVVDESGRVAPARFHKLAGDTSHDALVGAGWDAETRRLGTFSKGRGVGDCGFGQTFAWDGRMFRLVEQIEMNECRGSMDYITTWRAVVR